MLASLSHLGRTIFSNKVGWHEVRPLLTQHTPIHQLLREQQMSSRGYGRQRVPSGAPPLACHLHRSLSFQNPRLFTAWVLLFCKMEFSRLAENFK